MQISGKTESSFRRFNSYISSIVFVLIGIAFLVFTFMSFTTPQSDLVETTAEIVDVVKGATSDDESYVIINYATEDGTRYENVRYDAYSSGWKTGKEIKIMYDANDPSHVTSTTPRWVINAITGIVGVGAILFGVASFRRRKNKYNGAADEHNQTDVIQPDVDAVLELQNSDEKRERYYFRFGGKLNQSYIVEDKERRTIYDITQEKMELIKPFKYTFINHLTGRSVAREITHTTSTSTGNDSYEMVTDRWFKIDGVNCWNVIASKGYGYTTNMDGRFARSYNVTRYGVPAAYIEAASYKHLFDDSRKGDIIAQPGVYRIDCRPSDLDDIMLVAFCIARAAIL